MTFVALFLLGAVAVLITGGLGYMRAREALEQAIYARLTATRETKSQEVEMMVEAMHAFRDAVAKLDTKPVPDEVRARVGAVLVHGGLQPADGSHAIGRQGAARRLDGRS